MEKIQIKYHADIPKIEKIKVGDWVDLRAADDIELNFGDAAMISLGVSMRLPEGYEAHVVPRSSTFKNWGIIMTNGVGIIDNSYSGTNDVWRFPALCVTRLIRDNKIVPVKIKKGDRICQFRIVKVQPEIEFDEVLFLDEVDRGGFGSTGSN